MSVYRAANEQSANIVKGVLENEGIPAVVQVKYGSIVYDGAITMGEGPWGDVMVPESQAERATEILKEYNKLGG
ncbi:MAG: putative signal transducing protein [Armatimonadota bacterium]